ATGGLAATTVPADASGAGREVHTRAALLPLTIDGQRLPLRRDAPALGQHSRELLQQLGYGETAIQQLLADGVVAAPAGPGAN
ncbi:MAG: CoA transferase, partial [Rubrivivax sp.]|nr:CoA transferase [Rubrivivax sp.]